MMIIHGVNVLPREYGKKARAGLLLHSGSRVEWLTPEVLAVRWWRIC
jgi:hypothetical protein